MDKEVDFSKGLFPVPWPLNQREWEMTRKEYRLNIWEAPCSVTWEPGKYGVCEEVEFEGKIVPTNETIFFVDQNGRRHDLNGRRHDLSLYWDGKRFRQDYVFKGDEWMSVKRRICGSESTGIASYLKGIPVYKIINIEEPVKNKVIKCTFGDGDVQQAVCDDEDKFSLEHALTICIAKHMYGKSVFYSILRRGLKLYQNDRLREAKEQEEQKAAERRKAKKAAKRAERRARREAREREEKINIQAEAYIRAMKALEKEKNDNEGTNA